MSKKGHKPHDDFHAVKKGAGGKEQNPFCPLHEAHLALRNQRLSLCPRVGNEHRTE